MHLIESYSLQSGQKISWPTMDEVFYPVVFEKYITIQNSSGMDSKNYDYWQDVVDIVKPFLDKEGITIVQIGAEDSKPLAGVNRLCGKTNLRQTNFILRKALMHVGNDSFAAHVAPSVGTPLVALYGPTSVDNHGPFFNKSPYVKCIESHRNGNSPSFTSQESPKTINLIAPEEVAKAILEYLAPSKVKKITQKTLFTGEKYGNIYIQIVPNCVVDPSFLNGKVPTIRCDYEYNVNYLVQNLSRLRCSIITGENTPVSVYLQYANNIQNINYKVEAAPDLDYIRELVQSGLSIRLWTELEGDALADVRLQLLDIKEVHQVKKSSRPNIELGGSLAYKSYSYILSNNKVYLSKAAYIEDLPVRSLEDNTQKILANSLDFWEESEYFRIHAT